MRLTRRTSCANETTADNEKQKKTVYEKQVVFSTKKYADKARAKREKVILNAVAMVKEPGKYTKATKVR